MVATRAAKGTSGPFRVLVGINYPPNDTRAEVGDVVTNIPADDARWMLDSGLIEPAEQPAKDDA